MSYARSSRRRHRQCKPLRESGDDGQDEVLDLPPVPPASRLERAEVFTYNIELVEYLEEMGFDGIWAPSTTSAITACATAYPASCPILRRAQRGCGSYGIIVLPLHNPVLVAEEIAQLDMLSNGG